MPRLPSGLAARLAAGEAVSAVLNEGRALDTGRVDGARAIDRGRGEGPKLEPRDRAFARLLAATVLRRTGELRAVVGSFLSKPLTDRNREVGVVLLVGAAQLLYLDTPPHAAISLAVEHCRRVPGGRHLDKLVNAVLRRVAAEGRARLAALDAVRLDIPDWIWARWVRSYGERDARRLAEASLGEAALDISVKGDAAKWAARLGGVLLPTGSIRVPGAAGRIEDMEGFAEGEWWVQDAAAAIPARLLGDVAGRRVADLCAAPGGKSAELAAAGARVTAVDISAPRIERIAQNLARLHLSAEVVAADVLAWTPVEPFDAVLLDAPCTATGTIRRHPDILHLKREGDIAALSALQAALIDRALGFMRPGGVLVYCTCSLEPEEGVEQVERALARHRGLERVPITAAEVGGADDIVTAAGDLRTLPFHRLGGSDEAVGLDGFFAARLRLNG